MKIIEIFTKNNCPYCVMAKDELNKRKRAGIRIIEYDIKQSENFDMLLKRYPEAKTVPQIYIDSRRIGGYNELMDYFFDEVDWSVT